MFFIIISAVHVSGGFSAHHQELIKLCVQPWVCGWVEFQPIHTSGRQQESITIPKAEHIQFHQLLMMGGKTARNMYSADDNKEHCISCISVIKDANKIVFCLSFSFSFLSPLLFIFLHFLLLFVAACYTILYSSVAYLDHSLHSFLILFNVILKEHENN